MDFEKSKYQAIITFDEITEKCKQVILYYSQMDIVKIHMDKLGRLHISLACEQVDKNE